MQRLPTKLSMILLLHCATAAGEADLSTTETLYPKASSVSADNVDRPILAIEAAIQAFAEQNNKNPTVPDNAKGTKPQNQEAEKDLSFADQLKSEHANLKKDLKQEHRDTVQNWKRQHQNLLNQWKAEREAFLKDMAVHRASTVEYPVDANVKPSDLAKRISVTPVSKFWVIEDAMKVSIRRQGSRGTCSAFAGAKVVEVLLSQNNIDADVSEQFLYWYGKPDCQSKPCSYRGSKTLNALQESANQGSLDIPLEKDCPYQWDMEPQNVTHTPLSSSCNKGKIKVGGVVTYSTLDEAITAMQKGQALSAAFRLSGNFYNNGGLITQAESTLASDRDHSTGHAVTLVGYRQLPPHLHLLEGRYCLIAANSWGTGWGAGGYSCLTENWILEHRLRSAFVGVTSVQIPKQS